MKFATKLEEELFARVCMARTILMMISTCPTTDAKFIKEFANAEVEAQNKDAIRLGLNSPELQLVTLLSGMVFDKISSALGAHVALNLKASGGAN
jgi:hypothetical protein